MKAMSDVAIWIGSIGTFLAFLAAFYQIYTERKARKVLEEKQREQQIRDQAEHISAWVDTEEGGKYAVLAILNRSNEPVYQVIVTIVAFQGTTPTFGTNQYNPFRGFISVVPPGKVLVRVDGGYRGMYFHPGVEIVFVDKANQNWVRKGDGELVSIPKNPTSYYNLNGPFNWQLPKTTEPQTHQ